MHKQDNFFLLFVIACITFGCTMPIPHLMKTDTNHYKWSTRIKHPFIHVPVQIDGFIAAQTTQRLYLINAIDGTVIWDIPLQGSRENHPPVSAGDYILAPDNQGKIFAIEKATGKNIWSNQLVLAGKEAKRETIDDLEYFNGIVLVARHNSWLSAINLEDGRELWKVTAFARDPLFLESYGEEVYLIGGKAIKSVNIADGSMEWSRDVGGYVHATLKTGSTLFLGISYQPEDQIIALDLTGDDIKWFSRLPNIDFNCLVYKDDFIYFSGNGVGKLHKDSGKMMWANESFQHLGCPVIFGDKVYIREINRDAYGLDMNGGLINTIELKPLSFWDNDWAQNMLEIDDTLIYYRDKLTVVALSED